MRPVEAITMFDGLDAAAATDPLSARDQVVPPFTDDSNWVTRVPAAGTCKARQYTVPSAAKQIPPGAVIPVTAAAAGAEPLLAPLILYRPLDHDTHSSFAVAGLTAICPVRSSVLTAA